MQWRVDYDYIDALSPEERKWLSHFSDAYYGGDFRKVDVEEWGPEERSDVNRTKNASRTDAHTLAAIGIWDADGLTDVADLAEELESPELDPSPAPEYLEEPLYKEAREDFRKYLAPGRRTEDPKTHPHYYRARSRLKKVTP